MWLHVAPPGEREHRIWLPLFLLWLILLPFLLLAFLVAMLADVVLFLVGSRYHHYTLLLLRCCEVLGDTRGMVVHVHSKQTNVDLVFK